MKFLVLVVASLILAACYISPTAASDEIPSCAYVIGEDNSNGFLVISYFEDEDDVGSMKFDIKDVDMDPDVTLNSFAMTFSSYEAEGNTTMETIHLMEFIHQFVGTVGSLSFSQLSIIVLNEFVECAWEEQNT